MQGREAGKISTEGTRRRIVTKPTYYYQQGHLVGAESEHRDENSLAIRNVLFSTVAIGYIWLLSTRNVAGPN